MPLKSLLCKIDYYVNHVPKVVSTSLASEASGMDHHIVEMCIVYSELCIVLSVYFFGRNECHFFGMYFRPEMQDWMYIIK